jgi:hypothetical protein
MVVSAQALTMLPSARHGYYAPNEIIKHREMPDVSGIKSNMDKNKHQPTQIIMDLVWI